MGALETDSSPDEPSPPTSRPNFMYVPLEQSDDINEHFNTIYGPCLVPEKPIEDEVFQKDDLDAFKSNLGKGFVGRRPGWKGWSGGAILQQGLVLMQHLEKSFHRDVYYLTWSWLKKQLAMIETPPSERAANLHDVFRKPTDPYIFLLAWFPVWEENSHRDLPGVVSALAYLQELRRQPFRCFPSLSEMIQDEQKLGDIRALDAIAAVAPPEYSFRPRTCFKHGVREEETDRCPLGKKCSLQPLRRDKQFVLKRSSSQDSSHVFIMDCKEMANGKILKSGPKYRWFGQQYMPSLVDYGEFRVFIAAKPDPDAETRSRRGEVIHAIRTWHVKDKLHHEALIDERLPKRTAGKLGLSDLKKYALYMYEQLRARKDWKEKFESLEVGVRLDIGIGTVVGTGEKRFFVNEITRFYLASYFSRQTLEAPHQQICKAFAEGVHNYFTDV